VTDYRSFFQYEKRPNDVFPSHHAAGLVRIDLCAPELQRQFLAALSPRA
jgi:hypothetical protein